MQVDFCALKQVALHNGADHAEIIPVSEILVQQAWRDACASNACGRYGKCWSCPPAVGELAECEAKIRTYSNALVVQTITPIEDSFDFEGMAEAGARHQMVFQKILTDARATYSECEFFPLSAGSCTHCERCAYVDGKPCYFPEKCIASVEAYGIHVGKLAKSAGMQYINGANTVTYFAALLF